MSLFAEKWQPGLESSDVHSVGSKWLKYDHWNLVLEFMALPRLQMDSIERPICVFSSAVHLAFIY